MLLRLEKVVIKKYLETGVNSLKNSIFDEKYIPKQTSTTNFLLDNNFSLDNLVVS